jgi:hypothetical protein
MLDSPLLDLASETPLLNIVIGTGAPGTASHPDGGNRGLLIGNGTKTERLDRNWSTLLKELRAMRTGVQMLTGFLLTLPFQQRFDRLDGLMRAIYVATVACSLAATIALVGPVAAHRLLFRQRRLKVLVSAAQRLALAAWRCWAWRWSVSA